MYPVRGAKEQNMVRQEGDIMESADIKKLVKIQRQRMAAEAAAPVESCAWKRKKCLGKGREEYGK